MVRTYEMLRAIPAKAVDWRALTDALTANYLAEYGAAHSGATPWSGNTTDQWAAAIGVRALRQAAMEAASFAVGSASQRSRFIPPSPETLSWGGFLGGETVVWTDDAAAESATERVAQIIEKHATPVTA